MSRPNAQSMKPATAAKKLDVYLPATPAEFQENPITRDELAALQADPPQWLKDLRKNGPHPKNLVAAKLGISIAGLTRAGVEKALTTEQINKLLEGETRLAGRRTRELPECAERGATPEGGTSPLIAEWPVIARFFARCV